MNLYTLQMQISVVSATGSGNTELSAFDNALKQAGVYNYNIITLSSVIPKGTRVVRKKRHLTPPDECGWRLYVVKAEARTSDPEQAIGAGLGWYQFKDLSGVFVEHEIEGLAEKTVKQALQKRILTSLSDLCAFREETFSKAKANIHMAISPPSPHPRCALTLAVYKSEPWE